MKVSETLNKAADLIEERGWGTGHQSWANDPALPVCLEGAIGAAMGLTVNDLRSGSGIDPADLQLCPAGAALREHLSGWFNARGSKVAWLCHWNDADGRTADEVIEVLRACALIEEAREDQDEAYATYEQNLEAVR